jgi:regulator of RNase E activity RraA
LVHLAVAQGCAHLGVAENALAFAKGLGPIRDTGFICRAGCLIFRRSRAPADAVGRFNTVDFSCGVNRGGMRVNRGDHVFGDEAGVVLVPQAIILEVLEKAEAIAEKENRIRQEITATTSLADLHTRYGRF